MEGPGEGGVGRHGQRYKVLVEEGVVGEVRWRCRETEPLCLHSVSSLHRSPRLHFLLLPPALPLPLFLSFIQTPLWLWLHLISFSCLLRMCANQHHVNNSVFSVFFYTITISAVIRGIKLTAEGLSRAQV